MDVLAKLNNQFRYKNTSSKTLSGLRKTTFDYDKLKKYVRIALLIISLVSVGYLVIPYTPMLWFELYNPKLEINNYNLNQATLDKLDIYSQKPKEISAQKEIPKAELTVANIRDNSLLIPSIGVDTKIVTGSSIDVLRSTEGVWLDTITTPDSQLNNRSNLVLAGHRFQYLPPNTTTFYNLHKLKAQEKIVVVWNNQELVYSVFETKEVLPENVEIKNNSSKYPHILTLYTCTPIGTQDKRLVVQAVLVE